MSKTNGDHPKAYSRFTMADVKKLGIRLVSRRGVFAEVPVVEPGAWLTEYLDAPAPIFLGTEKSKSEFIIAQVLREVGLKNQAKLAIFSGYEFVVEPDRGLTGRCDYIFSKDPESPQIEAPVFFVTEAKNENLETGVPQCLAELYAARLFNERAGFAERPVFGAVTFGREWQFYRLDGSTALQDKRVYNLS